MGANACSRTCDYTRRRGREVFAAPLDIVVQHVYAGLARHCEDAANGVGWDEGEYVGATTWDTHELVEKHLTIGSEAGPDLLLDVSNALPQRVWSDTDPYGPRGHEMLSWSWATFARTVKHGRRYYFQDALTDRERRSEFVSPGELLAAIAQGCERFGLLRELPAGQRFFRCRARPDAGTRYEKPRDLGPPPAKASSQSRMSAAGIPLFYGARSRATAIAETIGPDQSRHAIAEFVTARAIRVLDLTKPPCVSIFDEDRADLYEWSTFMRSFLRDLQKPVRNDGSQHIDYVPTQIVTEYFRSAVRHRGKALDGVLYRSAKRERGVCAVLFADREDVAPLPDPSATPVYDGYMISMRRVSNVRRSTAP